MKSHIDRRTLVVKEYETLTLPETLVALAVFLLPSGEDVELDEVNIEIEKIISQFVFDGYTVDDKRTKFECGASACGQEIIFGIMIGIGGNTAHDILKMLSGWAKNKIYPTPQKAPENLESYMKNIKDIIDEYFLPTGSLSILEIRKTATAIKAKLVDSKTNKYEVELLPNGEVIKIKKLTAANSA